MEGDCLETTRPLFSNEAWEGFGDRTEITSWTLEVKETIKRADPIGASRNRYTKAVKGYKLFITCA